MVATILDHAVVCEDSDDQHIHLELYLRLGQTASAYYERGKLAFKDASSRKYEQIITLIPEDVQIDIAIALLRTLKKTLRFRKKLTRIYWRRKVGAKKRRTDRS